MDSIGASLPLSNLTGAFASGSATIAKGSEQISSDAQQIAASETSGYPGALLDLSQSSQLARAGADVIRASSQMLGTLLDVFA